MSFNKQMEELVQCKAEGVCARDKLVNVWLTKKIEGQDTDDTVFEALLKAKESDDNLLVRMLENINDG